MPEEIKMMSDEFGPELELTEIREAAPGHTFIDVFKAEWKLTLRAYTMKLPELQELLRRKKEEVALLKRVIECKEGIVRAEWF
jgi:hypothetical protein